MLCPCGGRRRQEEQHFASTFRYLSPVIQTRQGESREPEVLHGHSRAAACGLACRWYQSCSWRDRQECWLWIKHLRAILSSTIQQHLALKRCQASPQRIRHRAVRHEEFFPNVRIAALVCMPSTHTSGVGRVAGATVAATRKTCCC